MTFIGDLNLDSVSSMTCRQAPQGGTGLSINLLFFLAIIAIDLTATSGNFEFA